MVVLAIIGILAMIATPLYSDYVIRTQVAEGINLTKTAQVAAAEYFQSFGVFASSNTSAGLLAPTAYTGSFVTQVEIVAGGAIEVSYGNTAHRKLGSAILSMTPDSNSPGSIAWQCSGNAALPKKYLPAACRM